MSLISPEIKNKFDVEKKVEEETPIFFNFLGALNSLASGGPPIGQQTA